MAATVRYPGDGHRRCFEIEDGSFWFSHRNECIALALERHPFEGTLLDVGGGNGAVSAHLAARGVDAVVLEPGPEGAANARRRGLAVVCATLEEAAFAEGSFGAAGLFDVIEHVEDEIALLRRVRAVLRPGGVLIVTVPAHRWLWSGEDDLAGHARRYDERALRAALERAGFDVGWSTYFFAALTPPLFLLRTLPHRLGRKTASAEVARREHLPGPAARRVLDLVLAPERRAIRRGRRIPIGTSCLAVARRPG